VAAWGKLCFFVASFERKSRGLAPGEQRIVNKGGWRSRLLGLSSPARTPTRRSPHGIYKHNGNDWLGRYPFFLAVRRPWTLSVARRRSAGAFFCGKPGSLTSGGSAVWGGSRWRDAAREARPLNSNGTENRVKGVAGKRTFRSPTMREEYGRVLWTYNVEKISFCDFIRHQPLFRFFLP
jgi:hypothetical protein